MPRRFNVTVSREPRFIARLALGLLLAANLAAALMVFKPWGGTPEDLERELAALRRQVTDRSRQLQALRTLVANVEKGRAQSDAFVAEQFLEQRTSAWAIVAELSELANTAKIKVKEHSFASEPIEGSRDLSMLSITANYEGSYADLIEFMNLLDRSSRLMIIESLQAAPVQGSGTLNVSMKLNTFMREEVAE
jgi:type IV pilus assembly protein PilO